LIFAPQKIVKLWLPVYSC